LSDYTGRFTDPAFGEIAFVLRNNRLEFSWGVLGGPVEILDASTHQMRIEIAGGGNAVRFAFSGSGAASTVELQGVTFARMAPSR
jgi:hypothetical protein